MDFPIDGSEGGQGIDYNDPSTFAQFFGSDSHLPIPAYQSPASVRHEAEDRSQAIATSYNTLNEIIQRHESTIQKRWTKKTRQQRIKVLTTAWGPMAKTHRPDFNALRRESEQQRDAGTKHREYFMWPAINEEDLAAPRPLLLMLNARGRQHPAEFAAADSMSMRLGRVSKALVPIFLNGYTMILNVEASDTQNYGKLLSWDDHPDAFDWMHTRKQFLPGEGLLVLEVQQKLLEFLCGASAADDHLWNLRKDPGYFAEQIIETKEHRQEMLKDTRGKEHPVLKLGRENILWGRVIGDLLADAYGSIGVYRELHRQAQNLRSLHTRYAPSIRITEDLPEDLLVALLRFRHYLLQAAKGPLNVLKRGVTASPPMRKFFVREPPIDATSTRMQTMSRPGIKLNRIEGQLLWLLRSLWEDGHDLFLMGLPLVADELERLIQSEPQAEELLSMHIAETIGDLSILTQCLKQLELYQPWAAALDNQLVDREKDIKHQFAIWGESAIANIISGLNAKTLTSLAPLGEPSHGKFTYPYDKKRNKENVETLRRAEQSLDEFWTATDRALSGSIGTAIQAVLRQQRVLQRTPEFEDNAAVSKKQVAVLEKETEDLSLSPSVGIRHDTTQSQTTNIARADAAYRKAKVKTKGTPYEVHLPASASNTEALPAESALPVDRRALKVFRTLFYNPTATSSPGEVSWNEFLHAMTTIGFTASKLYGSVWQFDYAAGSHQGRIQFHEPHPKGKIPFFKARRFGRRLHRHFGWDISSFVLKEN